MTLDLYDKTGVATFYAVHDRSDPTLFDRIKSWVESQSPNTRIRHESFGRGETLVSGKSMKIRQAVRALVIECDDMETATIFRLFWSDFVRTTPPTVDDTVRVRMGLF